MVREPAGIFQDLGRAGLPVIPIQAVYVYLQDGEYGSHGTDSVGLGLVEAAFLVERLGCSGKDIDQVPAFMQGIFVRCPSPAGCS